MKVLIFDTPEEAVKRTARMITDQVQVKPASVLGLATGGTMPPVYEQLSNEYKNGTVSFANATSFNLDEYVGLSPTHPCSYHEFMRQELFSKTDFNPANTFLPRGDAPVPNSEADRYETLIKEKGPIDLQLLGIGSNGHIGFNEPTSSLASRTRVKTLTASTRDANKQFFADGETPPNHAITTGIGTIFDSKTIVLLALGEKKADAVAGMAEGPMGAHNPASALQMHPSVTVILDQAASAKLKLREYYFLAHPDGEEPEYR
ncbi:glucosamine-6-phosphate deaminase [Lentilitoribacter sp. EG35]|uniref:glucosamine-6-phosphate deaminase n=1 Tax=Lentilitoribacter sp. EG35 TaxID=3234192 RepID=UPI0034608C8F